MKPLRKSKKLPNTRIGWHQHFVAKFNKNENPHTAQMSLWYLFLHLAFDAEPTKTHWLGIDVASRDAEQLLRRLNRLKSTHSSKEPCSYHAAPEFSQIRILTEQTEEDLDYWLCSVNHGADYVGVFNAEPCPT